MSRTEYAFFQIFFFAMVYLDIKRQILAYIETQIDQNPYLLLPLFLTPMNSSSIPPPHEEDDNNDNDNEVDDLSFWLAFLSSQFPPPS